MWNVWHDQKRDSQGKQSHQANIGRIYKFVKSVSLIRLLDIPWLQNHSQNITLNGTWSTVFFSCSIQCKTLNETHTQPQQMTRSDEMHTKHCFFGVASMKTKGEPRTCCNHWTVPSTCFMIAVLSNRTFKSFSFYQLRFILLCETFTAEKKPNENEPISFHSTHRNIVHLICA